jgi:3-hydroxyisobutyrate dehydrogenase-like beta-hydroxyacid dehydrogenase
MSTCVAVLGQGEAGSAITVDLLAAGALVRAYDPREPALTGTVGCRDEAEAVLGADLVLSVNSAEEAMVALRHATPGLRPGSVWADLNTGSASLKLGLAQQLAERSSGVGFADVSLMSPVPGKGIRTPMLVSGEAAQRYADLMTPLGASVQVLAGPPGAAATRKLLRSVFYKGLAAAVVEALTAAEAAGLQDWLRQNIAAELAGFDAATLDRLVDGSHRHALRRSHEMAAAVELLTDLDVPARVATASHALLSELARDSHAELPPGRHPAAGRPGGR